MISMIQDSSIDDAIICCTLLVLFIYYDIAFIFYSNITD